MEQVEYFMDGKRSLAEKYRFFLKNKEITFYPEPKFSKANYWLNSVLLKDQNELYAFLAFTNANGVMTRPAWRLMQKLHMFNTCIKGDLSNSKWIEDRFVILPSSVCL